MACSIQITSVTGKRLPNQVDPGSILVTGTAAECDSVVVTISCQKIVGAGVESKSSPPSEVGVINGSWAIEFAGVQNIYCKCSASISITVSCKSDPNCFTELSQDLSCITLSECTYADDITVEFSLETEPPCVTEPGYVDVTLTPGGKLGSGQYKWIFGDGTTETVSSSASVTHKYWFPDTYTVQLVYTPTKSGCPPSSPPGKTVSIDLCPPEEPPELEKPPSHDEPTVVDIPPEQPDDQGQTGPTKRDDTEGSGSFGCDALLIAALAAALAGGLVVVGGICGKAPLAIGIGISVMVLAAGLLLLWVAICGKIASCSFMQSVHCGLIWAFLIAPVAVGIGAGIVAVGSGIKIQQGDAWCVAAIAGYWGWLGWVSEVLAWAMRKAGCSPTCP